MEQIFVGSTHLKKQIANLVFGLLYRLHEIPLKYSIFQLFLRLREIAGETVAYYFLFRLFFFRCHLRFYSALFLRTGLFRGIYKFMGSRAYTHTHTQQIKTAKSYSFNVVYTC